MSSLLFGASLTGEKELWRSQLAAILQLTFLMISAPSGKWCWAKGDRWDCFHNLFKYVVNFSSPFKLSPAAQTFAWNKVFSVFSHSYSTYGILFSVRRIDTRKVYFYACPLCGIHGYFIRSRLKSWNIIRFFCFLVTIFGFWSLLPM